MRVPALLATLVAGAGLAVSGWLTPLDDALRDLRFGAEQRAPSGGFAFVEIDSASLAAVGTWPWPRTVHAEVLNQLLDLGASEVAFDIDFSVPSTEAADAALESALADSGGYALLAGFRQLSINREAATYTLPLPRFAQHAPVAGVNVATDNAGTVRSIRSVIPVNDGGLTALPVLLGQTDRQVVPDEFAIDYSIDPAGIDRIAVADLLAGTIDPRRIADRKVLVGASALELRDVMMTPAGVLPGGLIQLLAAETVRLGRALPLPSGPQTLVIICFAGAALLFGRRRLGQWFGFVGLLACAATVEGLAFWLQSSGVLLLNTAAVHLMLVASGVVALAVESAERRQLHLLASRQRTEALEKLARLATHDPVTGALTRHGLVDVLQGELDRAAPVSMLVFSLERFDRINATLGHTVGDAVLLEVARRILALGVAAFSRISGEMFAVMPWGERAEDCAQRLRAALETRFDVAGHQLVIGCTIGYATGKAGDTPDAILGRAELARTVAASTHADAVAYAPAMEQQFHESRQLELGLREAIATGGINIYCQGQFALATGELVGAETLSRWRHPTLGDISPTTFVALAEETGLAAPFGTDVLRRSCALATQWPARCRLAVNLSPAQFELTDVPQLISEALEASRLDPARLDVEITEGVLLSNGRSTRDALAAIRGLGVGIALDDFGTGYSSLSYLSALPITKLKIDQSFVRQLMLNRKTETIVATILTLCRELGLDSIAEGVETTAQSEWLRHHGCTIGQGYLFHRPAPAAEFARLASGLLDNSKRDVA